MVKRYFKIIFIIVISIMLVGCWDYKDINNRSIFTSIGIDKAGNDIEFSGQIAKLAGDSSEGKNISQITDDYYFVSYGETFEEARKRVEVNIPFSEFLGTIRSIAIGENYAEDGIASYINRINSISNLRKSLLVVITKESPKNLFKGKIINDLDVGYAVENTLRQLHRSGKTVYKTAQQIEGELMRNDTGFVLPYITKQNYKIKYLGLAVMKDNKLIDKIDYDKSYGFLFLLLNNTNVRKGFKNCGKYNDTCSTENILRRRKINTKYKNGEIIFNIDLKVNSKLQYQYYQKYLSDNDIKNLEEKIQNYIKKQVYEALDVSQKRYKCDIFGFGRYFNAQHPKEYKKINWVEEYPKVKFNVNVKAKITDTNLIDVSK